MRDSMAPTDSNRPKIGIPWRTSQEECQANRTKIQNYEEAVRAAGGEPVLLSLLAPETLSRRLPGLAGFVLPGSPADVNPAGYGASNRGLSQPADLSRERTDRAILDHALLEQKPVLAICYGCQFLNVYLGGTLIQDLRSETSTPLAHRKKDLLPEPQDDPRHEVRFQVESRLARLAGAREALVNSSHHQSVDQPGTQLRVTGHALDGTIESVEWTGDSNWVVGVQWHPERMSGDPLAKRLFSELVERAQSQKQPLGAESRG